VCVNGSQEQRARLAEIRGDNRLNSEGGRTAASLLYEGEKSLGEAHSPFDALPMHSRLSAAIQGASVFPCDIFSKSWDCRRQEQMAVSKRGAWTAVPPSPSQAGSTALPYATEQDLGGQTNAVSDIEQVCSTL
jgi:hypothetical protein